jgi:hypothetical protein
MLDLEGIAQVLDLLKDAARAGEAQDGPEAVAEALGKACDAARLAFAPGSSPALAVDVLVAEIMTGALDWQASVPDRSSPSPADAAGLSVAYAFTTPAGLVDVSTLLT